jgi:hypothetical protein
MFDYNVETNRSEEQTCDQTGVQQVARHLNIEVICSSETSVDIWTAGHCIPEDGKTHIYNCQKFKSLQLLVFPLSMRKFTNLHIVMPARGYSRLTGFHTAGPGESVTAYNTGSLGQSFVQTLTHVDDRIV